MNYKNCRWLYQNYIDEKDLCLNGVIDEEIVNEEICGKCGHFYSYIDEENKRNDDNITDNLIGDLE